MLVKFAAGTLENFEENHQSFFALLDNVVTKHCYYDLCLET